MDNKNKNGEGIRKVMFVQVSFVGNDFDKRSVMNVDFQIHISSCVVLLKSEAHEGVQSDFLHPKHIVPHLPGEGC